MTKFEDVIKETGDIGPYQKRLIVLLVLITMPVSFNTNLPIMILTVPDHRCALENYPNDTYAIQNDHHRELINQTIPWSDDDQSERSSCTAYRPIVQSETPTHNNTTDELKEFKCDRYVFDKTSFDRTIIEELSIVCDDEEWRTHANMAMMMGKLVSALIQGVTSDLFGRRKSLLGFILVMLVSLFSNALIYNIPTLMAFRFLSGLATTSTYMNCFVIAMEFLGIRYRLAFNVILGLVWSSAGFIMTGVAYGLRDYVYVCIALGCPTLFVLSAFWLVPESPRWLMSKGRFDEAKKIVQHVAKVNGKPFPEKTFAAMVQEEEKEILKKKKEEENRKKGVGTKKQDSVLSLFLHPILTLRFLILIVNWMSNSMTYYGILLNVQNLSGDIYLNFFLTNCVDIAGNIASFVLVDRLGRKRSYISFLGIAMLACLASIFPPIYASKADANTILTVLSLIGRFGVSTSFNILYLLSAEIYPTTIRNTAMGVSSMASRVGSVSAPYVADMGKRIGGDLKTALPLIIFGGAALISWLGALLLPETNKDKMPDTIMDAVNFGRKGSLSLTTLEMKVLSRTDAPRKSDNNSNKDNGGSGDNKVNDAEEKGF